jgi:hypothetical protein
LELRRRKWHMGEFSWFVITVKNDVMVKLMTIRLVGREKTFGRKEVLAKF